MPTLYGPTGQPEPSPEIARRLRAVDPHLALRLNPTGRGWWLVRTWDERDSRRAMIQRGEMSPGDAWDLLTEIPLDCGAHDVPGYLERCRRVNGREDVRRMLADIEAYNRAVREDGVTAALAETMNKAELAAQRGFGAIPRVYNAGIPEAPPSAPPSASPSAPETPAADPAITARAEAIVARSVRKARPEIEALTAADGALLDAIEAAEHTRAEAAGEPGPRVSILAYVAAQRGDQAGDQKGLPRGAS